MQFSISTWVVNLFHCGVICSNGIPSQKVELHNGDSCMGDWNDVRVSLYRESKAREKHRAFGTSADIEVAFNQSKTNTKDKYCVE